MARTVLLLLALAAVPAKASLIVNGSFETPAADTFWVTNIGGSFPNPLIIPPGWQGSGEINVNRPSLLAFPGGMPDGLQAGIVGDHIGPGIMFQDVGAVLTAGITYTLEGFIGSRADFPGSGMISLKTSGGSLLMSSGSISPLLGTFQEVSLTYTALPGDPLLGQQLRVVLERTGGLQANFDLIDLSAAPTPLASTPEPASLALWSFAALALAAFRRGHRRQFIVNK